MLEPKYLVQFEEGVNIAAVVGCDVVNTAHDRTLFLINTAHDRVLSS
jgi:hypothetical protein